MGTSRRPGCLAGPKNHVAYRLIAGHADWQGSAVGGGAGWTGVGTKDKIDTHWQL